ncbi:hypothetical protein F4Y93_06160 [Candidatus Poribacteria bacterium]|nr:hypothetical protein [Candidatus Poribacteria bacterium]
MTKEKHEQLIEKSGKLKDGLRDLNGKYRMLRATTNFTECLELANQLHDELITSKPRTINKNS